MGNPYTAHILDHFRHPRNLGSLPAPDISQEVLNPLCGDRIRLELALEGEMVAAARFRGDGCAISIAATSLLTEMLPGRTLTEAQKLGEAELLAALQAPIPPGRTRCATLPLSALHDGIRAYRVTTRSAEHHPR